MARSFQPVGLYGVLTGVSTPLGNLLVSLRFVLTSYPLIQTEHNGVQYLAVSPMPNLEYKPTLGSRQPSDAPGCIQIWGVIPAPKDAAGRVREPTRMKCELVLCVEGGPAVELKWMPMGAWDAVSNDYLPDMRCQE